MPDDVPQPPAPEKKALIVWLQLLGLLGAVGLFGWIMMKLAIAARHG
jgi:hypothetical protein